MEYLIFDNIEKTRDYWLSIQTDAPENYYQSYEFNFKCYVNRKTSLSNILRGNTTCRFIVFTNAGEPIAIAPLVLDEHPCKAIRLLGHGTNAGTLDFVYRDSLGRDEMKDILDTVHNLFTDYRLDFIFVSQRSKMYSFLEPSEQFENYMIAASGYQNWFDGLSKKTRQNIRTSYNRLSNDGLCFGLKKIVQQEIDDTLLQEIDAIYQKRRQDWGYKSSAWQQFKRIRASKRDLVYQTVSSSPSGVIYQLLVNDKCAAFLAGYQFKNYIHVPRLAIDDEFSRYSPGMVLINECLKQFEGEPFEFNLGRGSEGYKKKLNGVPTLSVRGSYTTMGEK